MIAAATPGSQHRPRELRANPRTDLVTGAAAMTGSTARKDTQTECVAFKLAEGNVTHKQVSDQFLLFLTEWKEEKSTGKWNECHTPKQMKQ